MIHTLVNYFIQFGNISLPGIGSLTLTKNDAVWENNTLNAPEESIVFNDQIIGDNKQLIEFIADELNLTFNESTSQLENLLQHFTNQKVASLNFGNLGTFHKNGSKISWNSLYNSSVYYQHYTSIINENDATNKIDNKNWIISAVIILIMSITLIIYKQFTP